VAEARTVMDDNNGAEAMAEDEAMRSAELLTAYEAAAMFGLARRSAQRWAAQAWRQGDPYVYRVGRAWGAPEWWWHEAMMRHRTRRQTSRDAAR